MGDTDNTVFSLRLPASKPVPGRQALFRDNAMQARIRQGFGEVSINTPPSAGWVLLASVLIVALLACALWLVEVPQTASASGLIMPAGGLVRVSAPTDGQVVRIHASEKQAVRRGNVLLALSSGSGTNGHDGGNTARLRVESLLAEAAARRAAVSHATDAAAIRREALQQRLRYLESELRAAMTGTSMREEQVVLARERLERLESLRAAGLVSTDQLDTTRAAVLESQLLLRDLQSEVRSLHLQQTDAGNELHAAAARLAEMRAAANADDEYLQRQLQSALADVERRILATHDGIISHIAVTAGESVQQGQALLTMHADSDELMAWFYVPARHAARLTQGQRVSLRIDAFPYQLYGTREALIESVSAIALMPSQVDVPLAVAEPVFEARAKLLHSWTGSSIDDGLLVAGLSLRADILQGRHRLYVWLLRKLLPKGGEGGEPRA